MNQPPDDGSPRDLGDVLPPGFSRETKLRRDRHGRWFDGDEPMNHAAIERAFDRWIDRADDGRYILKNSVNWAYCAVEDAPVFVRQAVSHAAGVELVLSDGRLERLDPATLRASPDGVLYAQVRDGRLPARFLASALQALGELADEDDDGFVLQVGGARVRPPVVAAPLAWPLEA